MTYCLGMLCRSGAVFLSDSRTSAGMDNITMRSKMRVFEKPGDRVICIMSSGNLSLTQATLAMIDEDLVLGDGESKRKHIMNRQTFYETVRYVGSKVRAVEKRDRAALEADGFAFNINLIVGGQIAGMAPEVHLIYPQGNSIHATQDCPFLQIGETKYGKPILDRGFSYETEPERCREVRRGLARRDDAKQCLGRAAGGHSVLQERFAAGEHAHPPG